MIIIYYKYISIFINSINKLCLLLLTPQQESRYIKLVKDQTSADFQERY